MAIDLTSPTQHASLIFELRGHLPPNGRSWKYTVDKMAKLEAESRLHFPEKGLPRLKRFLSDIQEADKQRGTPEETVARECKTPEVIIRAAMRGIAAIIAREPAYLNHIEWRDLERILREVFEGLGFDTSLTRPGRDGGFDLSISVSENGVRSQFLVEVKHWVVHSNKPGLPHIKAFFEVVVADSEQPTGLLLSSSGFTKNSYQGRTEIEQQKIRLGDREKIVSLCQNYLAYEDGLWQPAGTLSEVLLTGTF